MANQSAFSVLTYQRQPGSWRAAISRKDGAPLEIKGVTLKSLVTSEDCASEAEALKAAEAAIRKI